MVAPYEMLDRDLARLHEQGARALRFILAHPGGLPLADLERWAKRCKEMGWHIQLLAKGDQLRELEPRIATLACPAVIDHFGMIRPDEGVEQLAFQAVLRLLRERHWVKLSAAYRVSQQPLPYRDLVPFVQALLAACPERLVWASDWPHVFVKGEMPHTTDLLDLLADWVPDEAVRRRILVENPMRLYGF